MENEEKISTLREENRKLYRIVEAVASTKGAQDLEALQARAKKLVDRTETEAVAGTELLGMDEDAIDRWAEEKVAALSVEPIEEKPLTGRGNWTLRVAIRKIEEKVLRDLLEKPPFRKPGILRVISDRDMPMGRSTLYTMRRELNNIFVKRGLQNRFRAHYAFHAEMDPPMAELFIKILPESSAREKPKRSK